MDSALEVFRSKRLALERECQRHTAAIEDHSSQLEAARAKLALLDELRAEMGLESPSQADNSPAKKVPQLGAVDAVRHFLESCPEGATQRSIVARLSRRISTESADPKRLLYNTIFNLKRRGHVREVDVDGEKRIVLAPNSDDESSKTAG